MSHNKFVVGPLEVESQPCGDKQLILVLRGRLVEEALPPFQDYFEQLIVSGNVYFVVDFSECVSDFYPQLDFLVTALCRLVPLEGELYEVLPQSDREAPPSPWQEFSIKRLKDLSCDYISHVYASSKLAVAALNLAIRSGHQA